jgi:hypothetical protein
LPCSFRLRTELKRPYSTATTTLDRNITETQSVLSTVYLDRDVPITTTIFSTSSITLTVNVRTTTTVFVNQTSVSTEVPPTTTVFVTQTSISTDYANAESTVTSTSTLPRVTCKFLPNLKLYVMTY